jgi:bifunctional UDP-N-acetylglucosamine pyrophosphorylase/glucosamine-1-phosphate N-acetyltransferase
LTDIHVVVLAAGKGTRMKSALPKVLHRVAGTPMIEHVLRTARQLAPASVTIIIGHLAESVTRALAGEPGLTFVVQEPQLGTAHALLQAEPALAGKRGTLILLSGDVPLLTPSTLETLANRHASTGAAATVVTATVDEPRGYGRIVRSGQQIARIVEEKDASPAERQIREINSGIYAFDLDGLFGALRGIAAENAQREYYLPDLVAIFARQGRRVETVKIDNVSEIQGINSRADLAAVSRAMRQAKNADLMAAGVTIEDPATTYIDPDVHVAPETIIRPGVTLERGTIIGSRCEIQGGVRIVASTIGDDVTILDHCLICDSTVGDGASIGPFAHLRSHTSLGTGAKVGNFVELKKTSVGAGTKSMHLAYLGDAVIGERVNIGAGTITCNYDGVRKQTTTIEDGAFIGSDTQLIAPITVGRDAYVGTGTTVREDVPAGALAVSAGKQRNIDGWVERRAETRKARTTEDTKRQQ